MASSSKGLFVGQTLMWEGLAFQRSASLSQDYRPPEQHGTEGMILQGPLYFPLCKMSATGPTVLLYSA